MITLTSNWLSGSAPGFDFNGLGFQSHLSRFEFALKKIPLESARSAQRIVARFWIILEYSKIVYSRIFS